MYHDNATVLRSDEILDGQTKMVNGMMACMQTVLKVGNLGRT